MNRVKTGQTKSADERRTLDLLRQALSTLDGVRCFDRDNLPTALGTASAAISIALQSFGDDADREFAAERNARQLAVLEALQSARVAHDATFQSEAG